MLIFSPSLFSRSIPRNPASHWHISHRLAFSEKKKQSCPKTKHSTLHTEVPKVFNIPALPLKSSIPLVYVIYNLLTHAVREMLFFVWQWFWPMTYCSANGESRPQQCFPVEAIIVQFSISCTSTWIILHKDQYSEERSLGLWLLPFRVLSSSDPNYSLIRPLLPSSPCRKIQRDCA